MFRFVDANNIVVTGTIIHYTPKPPGPPDSVEMEVDGYEAEVNTLLTKLRWTWTGWALIKDLWRETGTTILFVTHNPREAVTLATRVIALGRTGGDEDGANIVLNLSVPNSSSDVTIAGLIQRVEQTTFPRGGAESDEQVGSPEA